MASYIGTAGFGTNLEVLNGILTDEDKQESSLSSSPMHPYSWSKEFPVYDQTATVPDDPAIILGHGPSLISSELDWPEVDWPELRVRLRNLHPDYFNQRMLSGSEGPPFATGIGGGDAIDFSAQLGLAASLGFHWNVTVYPKETRPTDRGISGYVASLQGEKRWKTAGGEIAEYPIEANVSRDPHGGPVRHNMGGLYNYWLSQHSPHVRELHRTVTEQNIKWSANAVNVDAPHAGFRLGSGEYSGWSVKDFQDHLTDLSDSRVHELRIDDPQGFDISAYARSENLEPECDQILYEFFLMAHETYLDMYRSFAETVKKTGGNHIGHVPIHGLHGGHFSRSGLAHTVQSAAMDLIEAEIHATVPGEPDPDGGPGIQTHIHKLTSAQARPFDIPMVEHGMVRGETRGMDPDQKYPTLTALNCAETFANGSRRHLDITHWGAKDAASTMLIWTDTETGEIPPDLQRLADFLWLYKDELRGTPRSDIGIVYSVPTLLAQSRMDFGRPLTPERETMYGVVRALREEQLPADFVIFGHPAFWENGSELDELTSYNVLVFPAGANITDLQESALQEFFEAGGHVLHKGPFAVRDERNRPIGSDPFADYSTQIHALDGAGSNAFQDGPIGPIIDLVERGLDARQIKTSVSYPVSVEVTQSDDKHLVHFINYDYDLDSDTVTAVEEIEAELHLPGEEPDKVYIVTPEDPEPHELETVYEGDNLTFTVPRLNVWTMVVIEEETSPEENSKSDAVEVIDSAEEGIELAEEQNRTEGLFEAKASLREAELAMAAEQFDRSIAQINHAINAAEEAVATPVIGFDTGHGQVYSFSWEETTQFRSGLDWRIPAEFTEVTEYSTEQLNAVDAVLVVHSDTYSIDEDDVESIRSWVEDGGGLAIAAVPPPTITGDPDDEPDDLNALLEPFGFRLHSGILYREVDGPEDEERPLEEVTVQPSTFRTNLTYQMAPQFRSDVAGIEVFDENVDIHAKTGEPCTINGEGESERFPIYVSTTYGEGRVVCTSWESLVPGADIFPARNMLRWAVSANLVNKNTEPTPTSKLESTPATEPTSNPEPTQIPVESGGQPGTGIIGTVSVIVGTGYVLKWWNDKRQNND